MGRTDAIMYLVFGMTISCREGWTMATSRHMMSNDVYNSLSFSIFLILSRLFVVSSSISSSISRNMPVDYNLSPMYTRVRAAHLETHERFEENGSRSFSHVTYSTWDNFTCYIWNGTCDVRQSTATHIHTIAIANSFSWTLFVAFYPHNPHDSDSSIINLCRHTAYRIRHTAKPFLGIERTRTPHTHVHQTGSIFCFSKCNTIPAVLALAEDDGCLSSSLKLRPHNRRIDNQQPEPNIGVH